MDAPRAPSEHGGPIGRGGAPKLRLAGAEDAPRGVLRLAGCGPSTEREPARDGARVAEVEAENRAARELTTGDARWVFAVRVAGRLEGGRAAILTAEARERLMVDARRLGLRPFDGALVIAIVQDEARRGAVGAAAPGAGAARLALVRDAAAARSERASLGAWEAWAQPALALVCAAVALLMLVRWVLGSR